MSTYSPFDRGIDFDRLAGFTPIIRPLADGIRASSASVCASCAIIEYLDPNDDRVSGDFMPKGVAFFGHITHQSWSWASFGPWSAKHLIEQAVPWAHGVSHEDTVITEGTWAGQYEVKTHSSDKPKNPSAANHRQTQFRMRLRELAGMPIYGPTRVVTISTTGREKGIARGPWEVELTDELRTEFDATLAAINVFMARGEFDLHGDALKSLSDGCTRCFPKPVVQPVVGLDGLIERFVRVKREMDSFDAQRKTYADAKLALKSELDDLRTKIDPLVPDDAVVEAMSATARKNRAGTLVIKEHPKPAETAA